VGGARNGLDPRHDDAFMEPALVSLPEARAGRFLTVRKQG
jgi:hypothetical protein